MHTLQFIKKLGFGRESYYPDCHRSKELLKLKPKRSCFNKQDISIFQKDYEIIITKTYHMGNGAYIQDG